MQLGPVSLRFQSTLEVEANDNVRLAADHPQADLIFRPQVNALGVWQVTEKNRLSLSLGVGYAKYINTPGFDGLFLTPGSDLSFDVYVKDFVINFHDRFSYSQDVSYDPTVSGIGSAKKSLGTSSGRNCAQNFSASSRSGLPNGAENSSERLRARADISRA